jgi:hypothetical protein
VALADVVLLKVDSKVLNDVTLGSPDLLAQDPFLKEFSQLLKHDWKA